MQAKNMQMFHRNPFPKGMPVAWDKCKEQGCNFK